MSKIQTFLYKEFLLEWRQKYLIKGVFLYTSSTIFVCYLAFNMRGATITPIVWNTLFWIIILFSAINTIAKSFLQENPQRDIYYYSLASPVVIIISKIIYSALLMISVSFIALILYSLLLGNPVQDQSFFLLVLFLGSLGFSSTLTMVSGIASKAGNSGMLVAILSFPIIVPLIMMIIKLSKNAMDGIDRRESLDEILVLLALNAITITLALLLYPYLSKN